MSNIVIVGANEGIGYYMAERLLERGNKVCVLDIHTEKINELKGKYPNTLSTYVADASDERSLSAGINLAKESLGTIDIAVHNACLCTFESEPDTDYDVFQKVMNVNFFGALRLAKLVLPHMREARKGRVIFTSSCVGVTGLGNIAPYASSKGAIESLAKCLEIENRHYGISFHIMHPPLTDTASASGLPVPKEFKASPVKVGRGLADHIESKKIVICHSFNQSLQTKLCYLSPLRTGKMMWKMTRRAKEEK